MIRVVLAIVSTTLLVTACGGGGGGSGSSAGTPPATTPPPATAQTDFEQGIFSASATYKDLCLAPRAGTADIQGTTEDENDWLRAWSHDLYLWYDEIVDEDPRDFATPAYFDLMKTFATTPSGAPKDQFHFTFDTEEWIALSQSGISAGYGAEFVLVSPAPPREVVIAFVEAGSPAAAPGADMMRGTRVLEIDGVDVINANTQAEIDILNQGLFPDDGETHSFTLEDVGGTNRRTVDITATEISQDAVPTATVINTAGGPVGYMLFNTHIAPSEARLVTEMAAFEAAGIVDLVVDLRYNGGGFLDIANELAYMIAGPAAAGQVFDETQFNDKHPTVNPVTGQTLAPETFHTTAQGFSVTTGTPLPSVDLPRVFILTGPGTCSASEAIINGLRGIGISVVLIGETTCGKPYGFYATDNCGTTYFSIQFRGVNAVGFGDYADGFVPTTTPIEAYEVNGCVVADDYDNPLGDTQEARLATALNYIENGDCGAPTPAPATAASSAKTISIETGGPRLTKPRGMPGMVRR